MNRIEKAFDRRKAFIAFITGGDPDIETTERLILATEEAGADMIEIGIPFSDPVAEGAVIQQADERALAGGCTVDLLFDMVKRLRFKTEIPLLFMIASTSGERIEKISREAKGFLYCVSSLGVTGIRSEINTDIAGLTGRVKAMSPVPCAVGFGISTPWQVFRAN